MACIDCLLNCDKIVSDKCVQYTGPEIPVLGICPGDTLFEFEAAIVEKLLSFSNGSGISLDNLVTNGCSFMSDQLGALPKTLQNILQILWNTGCTLKELIDEIEDQIADNPVFNTACLTGLPANPTRDDILQSAVTLLCQIKSTVDAIPTTYVKISDLTNLVTQIVNNIINGGGGPTQQYTKMIPYVAVPYFGPLSNFDGTGKGIASLGFDKVNICNGNNGTPDIRGRVVVAAVRNVPGGAMDAAVDPANPNNPNWVLNDKGGVNTEILTVAQMPAHSHGVTDNGHVHNYSGVIPDGRGADASKAGTQATLQTSVATTGISIQSAGGNQPHSLIQPSIAANYIMFVP